MEKMSRVRSLVFHGHKRQNMNTKQRIFMGLTASLFCWQVVGAQEISSDLKNKIGSFLDEQAKTEIAVGKVGIDSAAIEGNTLKLFANINCSCIPFREENVRAIYDGIKALLPASLQKYTVEVYTDDRTIEDLIPMALRKKKSKKSERFAPGDEKALVTPLSRPYSPSKGLENRHIALWQSHGWYYESKLSRWEWQRARMMQTVEDLYTQSYVLPFLVPMLENAGANVLLPRERDCRREEIIIDNDGCLGHHSIYTETVAEKAWTQVDGAGFAHFRNQYEHFENPFREGSFRQIETIKRGEESTARWIPEIPVSGAYAVYVSYQTLANSSDDALYTVYHAGGKTEFKVNQQMGGGTWVYLGMFSFKEGCDPNCRVELSNRSSKKGRVVTADAVKIGGGMGNIARGVSAEGASDNVKSSANAKATSEQVLPMVNAPAEISGYPRFCEAARYWLQWAGVPDSVYSLSHGVNDYNDDYKSRGLWVNYLAGGSSVNPNEEGLRIPVDMAFAFHSDAGTTPDDSIIGTLGIYYSKSHDGVYANGASRNLAHDLTDLIQSNIVRDVRELYEPNWSRRGMWNKSYYEASSPRVPTMLLELLSHQNFADMRYGLDPRFRFTVSRAIYKGMLQFLSDQYGQDYVVQPLGVDHMALEMQENDRIRLTWEPMEDVLESTAKAEKYIVYTRIGDGDFDNGILVDKNEYETTLQPGVVSSYKVTAVNKGGESFPSEILSAGRALNEKGKVLVINGFDRISAPEDFEVTTSDDKSYAGFLNVGVPYLKDISYIGKMKEFRREIPWMDDDASGFGDSFADYENKVIAGNTFDYPALHGAAILDAGYSFVSVSDEAIESGRVSTDAYQLTDLILGKECQTKMGRGGVKPLMYKTFTNAMQAWIKEYCDKGGSLFVSGSFVGSDLWANPHFAASEEDKQFAQEVLKYKWRTGKAAVSGKVKGVISPVDLKVGNYSYSNTLNEKMYMVEAPDAIEPSDKQAYTVMRYSENNLSAGVAYQGDYRTFVMGFPFETIQSVEKRNELMGRILMFLDKNKN